MDTFPNIKKATGWAIYFGGLKILFGLIGGVLIINGSDLGKNWHMEDMVAQVLIGIGSYYCGHKLSKKETRKTCYFNALIIMYGISLSLILFTHILGSGGKYIIPLITIIALYYFVKGRKEFIEFGHLAPDYKEKTY